MFEDLSMQAPARGRIPLLVSSIAHLFLLTGLVVVPLLFYDRISDLRFITHIYREWTPEPPPVPEALPPTQSGPTSVRVERLVASPWVPPALVPDTIPPPESDLPGLGGPGFDFSGTPSGPPFLGFLPGHASSGPIHGALANPAPPAPPPAVQKEPIQVGGLVQSAKLIRRVDPVYPKLALRARIEGIVLLEVLIGPEGNVQRVSLIRGHPLLNAAAVAAVEQWKYSPTLLNGEPFPVIATVTVRFVLR